MDGLNSDDKIYQDKDLTEINKKNKSLITFSKINKLYVIPLYLQFLIFYPIYWKA